MSLFEALARRSCPDFELFASTKVRPIERCCETGVVSGNSTKTSTKEVGDLVSRCCPSSRSTPTFVTWRTSLSLTAAQNETPMKALLLAVTLANPILFVTQVPVPGDFTTVASTFGNHLASAAEAPRGGDLWIRYPDGTTKNLTRAAGFGNGGMQSAASIAVREPSVHWSGTEAL